MTTTYALLCLLWMLLWLTCAALAVWWFSRWYKANGYCEALIAYRDKLRGQLDRWEKAAGCTLEEMERRAAENNERVRR